MNDGLVDAFRYNAWATRELLAFCASVRGEAMDATAAGAVGSMRKTFDHMLEAESYYLYLLTGEKRVWGWQPDGGASIARPAVRIRSWVRSASERGARQFRYRDGCGSLLFFKCEIAKRRFRKRP